VQLFLVRLEVLLARSANRTEPGIGDFFERSPRGDPSIGIAVGGVIDESAGLAFVLHGPQA
jgi:hypothetical protein